MTTSYLGIKLAIKKSNVELLNGLWKIVTDACSSVTAMLHELNWPPLQLQQKINRLQILYKSAIRQHFLCCNVFNQQNTSLDIILTISLSPWASAQTNHYQNSFYPRTIKEWNKLATHNQSYQLTIIFITFN